MRMLNVDDLNNEGVTILQQCYSCSPGIVLSRSIIIILLSCAFELRKPFHCQEQEHNVKMKTLPKILQLIDKVVSYLISIIM